MIIVTVVVLVIAVAVSFLDVSVYIKALAIAVSAGFLVLGVARDLPRTKVLGVLKPRYWFVVALVVFLLSANTLARIYEQVWDVSRTRLYSLRQESIDWIQKLNSSVTLHVFLRSDDKTSAYIDWLKKSANILGDRLSIQVHNINRDVELTDKFGVNKAGEAVLESGLRWVKIDDFQESTIVKGLARLFNRESRDVCFLTDHGESDVADESPLGLSQAATALRSLGYSLRPVSLQTTRNIESTCSVLIIMGSVSDFFPEEITYLATLFGKVPTLVAVGPNGAPALAAFLGEKGLDLGQQPLLDQENLIRRVPLTNLSIDMSGAASPWDELGGAIFMPRSQSLKILPSIDTLWLPVLSTSVQHDVSETDGVGGPFLVVSEMKAGIVPKVMVVGSARSFTNANWRFVNNAGFFAQIVRYLLNESVLSLPEYSLVEEPLMDMTDYQATWVKYVVMYGVPGLMLALCAGIWSIHRRAA